MPFSPACQKKTFYPCDWCVMTSLTTPPLCSSQRSMWSSEMAPLPAQRAWPP
ncbi:hypothetical protein EMPG_14625 [Blastomyces silverae]|uniref:Uncharacterized protein n=1 Tax=Blastomyces silverae TaxID=2060906 RepID=A0A0H1BET5_9EURO|nr:hypothetical protein EMPG_14625 [Blastomyces silverae]